MGFTGISNISAQGMTTTITTSSNDTSQIQEKAHGYLVYKMKIVGEDMKTYKVLSKS